MKKIKSILPVLLLVGQFVNAQTIKISGTVSNKTGNPLHYAFVQDKQMKNGAYTDETGSFTLDANPQSKLRINCAGYNDTTINIDNKTSFTIALSQAIGVIAAPIANGSSTGATNIVENSFRDQVNLNGPPLAAVQGTIFPVFTVKEETRGSRYMLPGWGHGFVVNSKDSLIQRKDFEFNYDKTTGALLLTQDGRSAIEVDKGLVKSFTLYGPEGAQYNFENVPAISKNRYVMVVEEGDKYKIYKLISTEFVKSDYSTNGLTTSGNPYDEFVDKAKYYIVGKSGVPQEVSLRKKALKQAFAEDGAKADQYFQTNSSSIDENYLRGMGEYMNR
jgi:hypothetical protein